METMVSIETHTAADIFHQKLDYVIVFKTYRNALPTKLGWRMIECLEAAMDAVGEDASGDEFKAAYNGLAKQYRVKKLK